MFNNEKKFDLGLYKKYPMFHKPLGTKEKYPEGANTILKALFSFRLILSGAMGIVSGLPLMLTGGLLQAYLKAEGIPLSTIGLVSLLGLPYTLKFLWAPFMDRVIPLGRRRGWLLICQLGLIVSVCLLALSKPSTSLYVLFFSALLVAFFSASQDIVIDAYRRETLQDRELGLGSSYYIYGYRIGMLISGAGGLILADHLGFRFVYLTMASCIIPFIILTLHIREPAPIDPPCTLKAAILLPFQELLSRKGIGLLGAFILLYKIGDNMAANMTIPFFLEIGFSRTEIGVVAKFIGFWATLLGTFLGGLVLLKMPFRVALLLFGVLQGISTLCFLLLVITGPDRNALSLVVGFENISAGMGTSGLAAFMAKATDKRFTATQYALFSSLMGVPRVITSSPAGYMAQWLGWEQFFVFCTLLAIPGLLILFHKGFWKEMG